MDPQSLFQLFSASLSPDPATRIQGETQLMTIAPQEGLISGIIQILAQTQTNPPSSQGDKPPPSQADQSVAQSAAVYLKNAVLTRWTTPLHPAPQPGQTRAPPYPIPASDRANLKANILPLMVACPSRVVTQLRSAFQKLVDKDFPQEWQELLPAILQLVQTQNQDFYQLRAGLMALLEMFRVFRWISHKTDRTTPHMIVNISFPHLLSIAQRLVQSPDPSNEEIELLYLICKVYKTAIHSELPQGLRQQESIVPWCTFFLQMVGKHKVEENVEEMDPEDRGRTPWWLCKKWCFYILNRLFSRWGRPGQLSENIREEFTPFATHFQAHFAPEILKAYLQQVELVVTQQAFLSNKCTNHLLLFFDDCVKPKQTWELVQPHIDVLLTRFVFPLMCQNDDELNEFENDPADYCRSHFAEFVADYYDSPASGATTLLLTLAQGRKKSCLMPILNHINAVVDKYPSETTPKQKDGALRVLATLAEVIKKSKRILPMMDGFMMSYVYPDFESPHAILRARACDVIKQFEANEMKWKEEDDMKRVTERIMALLHDPHLAVRVSAYMCLPEMTAYAPVHDSIGAGVGKILGELIDLSNEVDIDTLARAGRSLVTQFRSDVEPCALQLTHKLMESYMRIMQENLQVRNELGEDKYEEEAAGEEKTLVAMSLLKTTGQLVVMVDETAPILLELEAIIAPPLAFTLHHNFLELYSEVFELVDSLCFSLRTVTPHMWNVFDKIYETFKAGGVDFLAEILTSIENFVFFGKEAMGHNLDYSHKMVDMFEYTATSDELSAAERCLACKLADAMLMNLRGQIDQALPTFVGRAMGFLTKRVDDGDPSAISLQLHSILLVVNAIYYNPVLSLSILEQRQWTNEFFRQWIANLTYLTRVYDRKVSLLAISSVLNSLHELPPHLQQQAGQMVMAALGFFKGYPEVLVAKATIEHGFEAPSTEDDGTDVADDDDTPTEGRSVADDKHSDENEDLFDNDEQYLETLARQQMANEAEEYEDESDTDSYWSQEIIYETPMDQVDAYVTFVKTLSDLEARNPQMIQALTSSLNAEQQEQLNHIVQQSKTGGEGSITKTGNHP